MKAVKISKIIWSLDSLKPAERGKAKAALPTGKGFIASDDFNVVDKVPNLLKKKFGYDIINFSYTEIHISESIESLLKAFAPKGEKPKKLFNTKGELSDFGTYCYNKLIDAINQRKELEAKGTPEDEMPKILDKVMFSLEKITGIDWDGNSAEEFKTEIDDILQDKIEEYLKSDEVKKALRKEAKKSIKDEMKKMDDDEDDDDEDDDDDEEYDD